MKYIPLTLNQKFGRWTVINLQEVRKRVGKSKALRIFIECKCDCGTIGIVRKDYLLKGGSKSCGCLIKETSAATGRARRTKNSYLNNLYGEKKRSAKYRQLDFELTKEEFESLIIRPCYYCGEPAKLHDGIHNRVGLKFPINGIDRLNSNIGYIMHNCVPSCFKCNSMKMDIPKEDFLDRIKKIYEYQNRKED